MSTMTMQTVAQKHIVERSVPTHTKGVSHLTPILVALVLLAVSGIGSVLISGPMQ
jgi:hypothetical protein